MRLVYVVPLLFIHIAGCATGGTTSPSTIPTPSPALGAAYQSGDSQMAAVAIYDIDIDPATSSATATLRVSRSAQENDDLYLLPISNFLRTESFKITGVGLTATTIDLSWRFTHPYLSYPNSSRSDLGFTGYLMFLADVPAAAGNTYFEGGPEEVVLNSTLITNADAYWKPAGLLNLPGINATAFPCQLVVNDEDGGNRLDPNTGAPITNGDKVHGNFDPTTGGWQTLPSKDWTGFDVLHQGQASTGMVSLDRATVAATPYHLIMTVIAKYCDPRSATPGRQHRNPGTPPDVLGAFSYRFPHGCLDVSRLIYRGQKGKQPYMTYEESNPNQSFHVRDWDAEAPTSTQTDLALEADPGLVLTTSIGAPTVKVCIPSVIGDAAYSQDMGTPDSDDDLYPHGD
ncbi:MAG: hypothetical protein ABI743_13440, partial [bacterium]